MLAAPPPTHHVQRARAGNVQAVLAWDRSGDTFANIRVSVSAGGRLLVSRPIGGHVQVYGRAVRVVRLSPEASPTVLVDVYTGGAHCCTVTRLFLVDGTRLAGQLQRNWGDPGYRLVDLDGDGTLELRSADDAFAYEFTDYADSALPIRIWNLRGGRLVDTTSDHPGAVAADARTLLSYERQAGRQHRDPRGVLAAYVADEAVLGTPDVGWQLVDRALATGQLDQGISPPPTGSKYVAYLRRFLTRTGYLR